jgi:succinate dehydrogenase / fumarate reductase membrane anchor subunit
MQNAQTTLKSGENTILWLLKIGTGALVLVLLLVHLIVNHFTAPNGLLSYQDVVVYFSNPWVAVMELLFLIFVVSHALLGLRSVLLDLHPGRVALGIMNWMFTAVGVAAVAYGIWLTFTIVARAK